MHRFVITIRPTDLDSFGHVNNARYLEYLEWARLDWSLRHGLSYARFQELGVIPAVTEAKLRFQREVHLLDTLTVETRSERLHSARVVFHQQIYNQNGERVLRGEVSLVAVDVETRSFTDFPIEVIEAVEGKREPKP
jgi:thioesterase-3